MDQAQLKVSLWNVLVIMVIVILFVPLTKYAVNKWGGWIPGLPTAVNAI